jgi:hypothetical protein
MAQSVSDINGLASAASQFAAHGVSGTQHQMQLDLREIKGDNALVPGALMNKALDIQRWTFFYNLNAAPGTSGDAGKPAPMSASCKCVNSLFSDFHLAAHPIPATKSLQFTWVATTVDQAIQALNQQGYVRGFSEVKLVRPDAPGVPDGYVYIFNCPWERTLVAVSAASGEVTWLEQY